MRILFVASEVARLIKVGGLADVAGALPKALTALGHDVRVMMPSYGSLDRKDIKAPQLIAQPTIQFNGRSQTVAILQTELPQSSVPLYLIDCPEFFQENGVYLTGHDRNVQRRST